MQSELKDMFNRCLTQEMVSILTNKAFSNILPGNVYLGRGTAIAIYCGHRLSIDIDLFSDVSFNSLVLLANLKKNIFRKVEEILVEENTLVCVIYAPSNELQKGVKVSLFTYPYPKIDEEISLSWLGINKIRLLGQKDLIAMKAVAIAQRGTAKDFVDFYYLVKNISFDLSGIFYLVKTKYDVKDNYLYHLKTALVYFNNANREYEDILMYNNKMDKFERLTKKKWDDIKNFMRNFVLGKAN